MSKDKNLTAEQIAIEAARAAAQAAANVTAAEQKVKDTAGVFFNDADAEAELEAARATNEAAIEAAKAAAKNVAAEAAASKAIADFLKSEARLEQDAKVEKRLEAQTRAAAEKANKEEVDVTVNPHLFEADDAMEAFNKTQPSPSMLTRFLNAVKSVFSSIVNAIKSAASSIKGLFIKDETAERERVAAVIGKALEGKDRFEQVVGPFGEEKATAQPAKSNKALYAAMGVSALGAATFATAAAVEFGVRGGQDVAKVANIVMSTQAGQAVADAAGKATSFVAKHASEAAARVSSMVR